MLSLPTMIGDIMSIYQFVVKDKTGQDVRLTRFQNKVLLIVNTASKCGLTPQLKSLQYLYQHYQKQGLEILGFPCNQFAQQDPGSNEEIQQFCQINYGVTFPILGKIEVNGKNADPLFIYLKEQKPGLFGSSIKWNFTKFLINRNGKVVKRFSPITGEKKIEKRIQQLL
jgi:glutathione peroxidase